jgi:Lon protease-like protein
MHDDPLSLTDFCGTARLFPLPDLVLFPSVVQPLHIFESRYRQMTADALAGDRLIALALLKPGWEEGYHDRPPIFPVVCLGRIVKKERLADGCYNLLLHGLSRARIVEELQTDHLYRTARVDLLPEAPDPPGAAGRDLRERLGKQMERWLASRDDVLDQLDQLLKSGLSLGTLCDIFSFALPFGSELKQSLLEETDPGQRVDRLLSQLDALALQSEPDKASPRHFPPEFSSN